LEPHVKNLHLTLAYQFPPNAYQNLLELVEKLDTSCANSWELRLYSRDPRLATKHVYKVIYSHSSREHDELELRVGDYVYINGEAALQSVDGWVEGITHNGNHIGCLPLNHVERVCETEAWKLHVSAPLVSQQQNIIPVDNNINEVSVDAIDGIVHTIENGNFIRVLLHIQFR
jgi:ubiquitin-associated SH3 domain-containing protein